jgi:class I fructose-bisphosphate aldolase
MDSRTGKIIRLGRILRPESGRALCIAYSHGALLGPIDGMRTEPEMHHILATISRADAVMVSPGMLPRFEQHFVGRDAPALIVMVDWQNVGRASRGAFAGSGGSAILATAEDAIAAGADAVMTYLWLGGDDPDREREEIARNSHVLRACERLGLPVMIESRGFSGETLADGSQNLDLLRYHMRVAAELGADFIKTKYSGDPTSYAAILAECQVPVLVAGGSRLGTTDDALKFGRDCMSAGAAGLIFGRNIFAFDKPRAIFDDLYAIVHNSEGRAARHPLAPRTLPADMPPWRGES